MGLIPGRTMTEKQARFVELYLNNGEDATSAAIEAGYKQGNVAGQVHALMNNPRIINQIEARKMAQMTVTNPEEYKLNYDYKLQCLYDLIQMALDGKTNKHGTINGELIVKAIAEANKMQGDYAPTKSVTTNISSQIDRKELMDLVQNYIHKKGKD